MAHLLYAFGIHNLGDRNYDYTEMYGPDKPGEEAKENARVWNVYLDEAESHDADMIEGYRSIIESLLVFAALFSAVVTTFVAQTSQALKPDNAQIMVSLLVETNQLLRAAGNKTYIDAVPPASLGSESQTYTSIDAWVNGLFFTSLALSLSTALLSVLAKQWLQAYTATVSGDVKTRALIRQSRFEGLVKWKLGEIIESLPLILHCSVAVFLVGLALYASQLSRPICYIVAGIAALTFVFYFTSSMLPAFYMACPYRIPSMFALVRCLLQTLRLQIQPLKIAEHNAVLAQSRSHDRLAHDSLGWVFKHSSNHLVKEIVIEGTCGLLDEWSSLKEQYLYHLTSEYLNPSCGNTYLLFAIKYSLSKLPHRHPASSMEDEIGKNKHGRLIVAFMKAFNLNTLLDGPTAGFNAWQEQIRDALFRAYSAALRERDRVLSRWLLDLGGPTLFASGSGRSVPFLFQCIYDGDAEDFRDLVHRGIDLNCSGSDNWTALHCAAFVGNMDVAIALVEREPALVSVQAQLNPYFTFTALDFAILNSDNRHANRSADNPHMMVTYLLDHGAHLSSHILLYNILAAFTSHGDSKKVELLIDCGWDRTDAKGQTILELARSKGNDILIEYLEHYQTVRYAPYGMTSCVVNDETA